MGNPEFFGFPVDALEVEGCSPLPLRFDWNGEIRWVGVAKSHVLDVRKVYYNRKKTEPVLEKKPCIYC